MGEVGDKDPVIGRDTDGGGGGDGGACSTSTSGSGGAAAGASPGERAGKPGNGHNNHHHSNHGHTHSQLPLFDTHQEHPGFLAAASSPHISSGSGGRGRGGRGDGTLGLPPFDPDGDIAMASGRGRSSVSPVDLGAGQSSGSREARGVAKLFQKSSGLGAGARSNGWGAGRGAGGTENAAAADGGRESAVSAFVRGVWRLGGKRGVYTFISKIISIRSMVSILCSSMVWWPNRLYLMEQSLVCSSGGNSTRATATPPVQSYSSVLSSVLGFVRNT